jgi:hypothetical protein
VPTWARVSLMATLALSVPLGAHMVSGMETALATGLATLAAVAWRRPRVAAILAGLSASLRPEMAPWACVLGAGLSIASREGVARAALAAGLALVPFSSCAVIRALVWGRPAPLALWAKPSDLGHGVVYAVAALAVSVVPILLVSPRALWATRPAMALAVAASAHIAAIVAVGGDWMPFARLIVPILPSLAYAAVLAAACARPAATAVRCALAAAAGVGLLVHNGSNGRHVGADRAGLIAAARPWLAASNRVAAVDIGWVSAATEADIVDLAGVTDPEVAALPGGHTSKRVGPVFLLGREPDALLLYSSNGPPGGALSAWREASYPRVVEERLAHDDVIGRHFSAAAWLALGTQGAGYVLLRKAPSD